LIFGILGGYRQYPILAYWAITFSSGIRLKQKLYIYKAFAKLHNLRKSQRNSLQIETIGTYPDPNCPLRGQIGL